MYGLRSTACGLVNFSIWLRWRHAWRILRPLEELGDTFGNVFFAEVAKIFLYFLLSNFIDDFRDDPRFIYPFEFPGVAKDGLIGVLTWRVNLPSCVDIEGGRVRKASCDVYLVNDQLLLRPAFSYVLASLRIGVICKWIWWHSRPEFLHALLDVGETLELRLLWVKMPIFRQVNSVAHLLERRIEAVQRIVSKEGKPYLFNAHREEVLLSCLLVVRQKGNFIDYREKEFFVDSFILRDGS